jgi:hypothetical protein
VLLDGEGSAALARADEVIAWLGDWTDDRNTDRSVVGYSEMKAAAAAAELTSLGGGVGDGQEESAVATKPSTPTGKAVKAPALVPTMS